MVCEWTLVIWFFSFRIQKKKIGNYNFVMENKTKENYNDIYIKQNKTKNN